MASNAAAFSRTTDHEARNILQEHKRDFSLTTKLNKVSAFNSALSKQHAVVGKNANGNTVNMGKTCHQCFAKPRLKFIKPRTIHHTGNHFLDVERLAAINGDQAKQFFWVECREFRFNQLDFVLSRPVQIGNRLSGEMKRMGVIFCQVICHT